MTRLDRDPKCHNVTWRSVTNAANFAADVSELCIERYAVISPSTPVQTIRDYLACARDLIDGFLLHTTRTWMTRAKAAEVAFRAVPAQARETQALKELVATAFELHLPLKRKPPVVANDAGRWTYHWALTTTAVTEAEIEQIEIQHRIADRVTPPSDNCRQAFEAVWVLGKFRDAIRLLHRKEVP